MKFPILVLPDSMRAVRLPMCHTFQVHLHLPPVGIAFDESSGIVKDILAGMAKVSHVFLGWHCKGWICFQGILESREFDADQRTGR